MSQVETNTSEDRGSSYPRTGPIGRLARLLLALVIALWPLYSIVDDGGPASFRDTSNLTEPVTLLLNGVLLVIFVLLVGQLAAATAGSSAARRWQVRAVIGLAIVLAAAAGTAWIASGEVWASPLPEIVWAFDAVMLVETIVALLLAIVLGTPGCEVGVWPELIARVHSGGTTAVRPICVLGLHLIDDWEARRRSEGGPTTRRA
jgi:hypothetical protein